MDKTISGIFENHGISLCGAVKYADCGAANARLHEECADMKTVFVFAVPYRTGKTPSDGLAVSEYARVYDYHQYFETLFSSLIPALRSAFPKNVFKGFADHSPINEKKAASAASLGVVGMNTLLITKDYGSYVFLGSVITDLETETENSVVKPCIRCGRCVSACPGKAISESGIDTNRCVSAITQKKIITDEEKNVIVSNKAVWGCDVCQSVCPMNEGALTTGEKYFTLGFLPSFSHDIISGMDDAEFGRYPFAWRKKDVILRNLDLVEKYEK